ncbi:ABC transporter substrate-binding protein [Lentilactobacillus hilgardii]|uniref:ABC transporter substrate-binding protein n=1 Tax=Lentilactobacillus hilgardii TaxID=1588 RepID=UPI003FA56490
MIKKLAAFLRAHILPAIAVVVVVIGAVVFTSAHKQTSAKAGRTPVVLWHEMGGPAEVALDQMVDKFNKSQSTYEVIPQYQGAYDEVVQKIIQSHGSSASPALFQSFDISTAQMMHSKYTTPVQKFIDEDNYDVSDISPVARSFYSNKGKQLAMPFNTSQPVLYYNASLLKKYHITPPAKSPSYSDVTRVAEQLYKRSHHQVKGMTMEIYGWLMEEALANAKTSLVNHGDGHVGNPTKIDLNNPTTVKYLKWIRTNIKSGDFVNYGSGASAETNEIAAFLAGKLGIFVQSSAYIGQLTTGNKNKLGISYFPHPNGQKANGVGIGGAALWISNDKPTKVQKGAFEFIKYAERPDSQANWQKATGYLALNSQSQSQPALKSLYAKQPEAKVPGEQLAAAKPNDTNSGILMEGMQLTREMEETAMETVYDGGSIPKGLSTASQGMNTNLKTTNRANGDYK